MTNFNDVSRIFISQSDEIWDVKDRSGNILWERKPLISTLISTGTQVIDTGVYCTNKMSCEIKMAWTAYPSTAAATYIGAIEYNNGSYLRCHFQLGELGSEKIIGFWQDSPTLGNPVSIPYDNEPHILTYSAKNMTVGMDGVTATHGNSPTPSNSTFYLFDRNVVGFTANSEPGKCKLYYAKFYNDDILIRHLVPDLDYNNRPCLYDLVNHKYYYDLNGGSFEYE